MNELDGAAVGAQGGSAHIIPRSQHPVSRKSISRAALKVLYTLHEGGFEAHLVGGGVRDLLLGLNPKDFDVATDARPEQVKELFPSCRLIGRRFRLAHVRFGREIIEVATFRGSHHSGDEGQMDADGRIVRDNVFGDIEEDAVRRDFTINALYYNIADFSIVDYVGGCDDLKARTLRLIGDPATRYREDAVRMLRAARFRAKLGFELAQDTRAPIEELRDMLLDIPTARLFEEALKLLQTGHAKSSFDALRELKLLQYLFPVAERHLEAGTQGYAQLVENALANTDKRVAEDKPVTPAFLYAVLLWPEVQELAERHQSRGEAPVASYFLAADQVIPIQLRATSLPKRYSIPMREIWALQPRLIDARGKRAQRVLGHPRFRAGYDFLCLRAQSGETDLEACARYWTERQENVEVGERSESAPAKRRRPRRRRGPKSGRQP